MDKKVIIRVVIYARDSTDKQGETIENQLGWCREWVRRKNTENEKWVAVEEYFDHAISASKVMMVDRPAMKRLIEDAKAKKFDVVIFKGLSRSARDTADALKMARTFEALGIRFVSTEENYDSLTSDEFIFTIHSAAAQKESTQTSIRVSLGNKQKARNGKWANSKPPMGYVVNKETKKLDLGDDDQVEIIKRIFYLYVNEDLGTFNIAKTLNEEGILTTAKNKWSRNSVARILKNYAYAGDIMYGKKIYKRVLNLEGEGKIVKTIHLPEEDWAIKRDAHPAIIDKEMFEKAKTKLQARNLGQTFKHVVHPLTGLLKCGICGEGMICQKRSTNRKEYRYYICKTYHKYGRNTCRQANINAEKIEKFLLSTLKEKVASCKKGQFEDIDVIFQEKEKEDILKKVSRVKKEIEKTQKDSLNLVKKIDILTEEQFIYVNDELKKELKKLLDKKQDLEEVLLAVDKTDNIKLLREEMGKFLAEEKLDLRKYFHLLVSEIIIRDGKLEIQYIFKD